MFRMGKGSDTAKAAGLIALIVLFLGFTAYRLMGGNSETKKEPVAVVPLNLQSGDDLTKVAGLPHTTSGLQGGAATAVPGAATQQALNGIKQGDSYSGPIP